MIGGEDRLSGIRRQPRRELPDVIFTRTQAVRDQFRSSENGYAVASHHPCQRAKMIRQRIVKRAVTRKQFEYAVLESTQPDALAITFSFFLRLDLPDQCARKRAARGADVIWQQLWARVMAKDHTP